MVFAVVALALIWKRVVKPRGTLAENGKPMALILLLTVCCIGKTPLQGPLYCLICIVKCLHRAGCACTTA